MGEKAILILANATKLRGRCVAGLEVESYSPLRLGRWIRPVSGREHGIYFPEETHTTTGSECGLLDVVTMEFGGSAAVPSQPENRYAVPGPWPLVTRLDMRGDGIREALLARCEKGRLVLSGVGGSVPEGATAIRSLELREAMVEWEQRQGWKGPKKVRARLWIRNEMYDLPVTDPDWIRLVLAKQAPQWTEDLVPGHSKVLLTLSLGEPFMGKHWKLVAGVIPLADSSDV